MVWFGLDAEEYDRQYSDTELFKRIFQYFKPYSKKMGFIMLFIIIGALANGFIPFLSSRLINNLIEDDSSRNFVLIIVVILFLNLLGYIFNYVNLKYSARVINNVVYDLRSEVDSKVLIQDMSFFDKYPTGKIVSRINSDSQNFGEMSKIFMQTISSFIVVIIIFIPMFFINWELSLIFLVMIPLIFIYTSSCRKGARRRTLLGQRILAKVNAFVQETMTGILIAKTFRQEHTLYEEFNEINNQSFKVNLSRALFLNIIFPGLGLIQAIMIAVIVYSGGNFILDGALNSADVYLFIQSLWSLFFPLFQVAAFWPQFQTGMSAAERTFALIDSKPMVKQKGDYEFKKIEGKIVISNLNFEYNPEKPVFKNFSLSIEPGESVAIVGHTGAGKSSLARIILRYYDFQSGEIFIDGQNLRNISLEKYRNSVGLIPQTPFLWSETLENNIRYGSPQATREDVLKALKLAGGSDWVDDLEKGIETNIGERGKLLSMGQKQLVVFARVLLQDPSILILDEATASVDPFTETRIQEALEKLMENRTSIVIAHRLHTVRHVDRIIVLDHGTIVEEGSHDFLMEKGGYYANLYNTYFRHQSYDFLEQKIE